MQPTEYHLLHQFRYEIRRFLTFSESAAREAGIEPQQHQLLLALRGGSSAGTLTIGEIAERLQLRHNSAVELVNRATERGLVQRSIAAEDRRRVDVALTGAGDALLERLSRAHLQELRTAAPSLVRVLEQIVAATSAVAQHEAPANA